MPNDVTPLNTEEEGLNLWELLDAVKSGWYWLVGGAVLGLAGALGFILIVPPQHEATAVIQPATVGMATSQGVTSTKGAEVESVAQTLERLKMPTFYSEALLNACGVKNLANPRQTLATAVKPTLIKGNSLIQISYRAVSPALAEACVAAVVTQLSKVQAALAEPLIKTLEEQRKLTKQQLDESERFQVQIEKRAMSMDPSDAKFSQSMLMLNAALSKREEISKLRKLYTEQSLQLAEPLTQSAKLFEPIYSPDRAVFPKKTLTALGGLVGGLFAGVLLLFVNRSWHRFKRS
ncbi:MAG: Wzz/FepE/Etk N-terminal domain-containing protein [Fluviibacter phosphoraccumulans]